MKTEETFATSFFYKSYETNASISEQKYFQRQYTLEQK